MKEAFVGFDIGGTNISAGLVSKQGKILDISSHPTQVSKGKKQIIQNILELSEKVLNSDIKCLGISLAHTSIINVLEIKSLLSKKYKCPIYLENDANLFAFSEALIGQGKKYKTVVGITLGTGLGCGVVDNKKIFNGRGKASEFGHVSINFNGPKCLCGHRGCFEEYASARALKRLAKKYKLPANTGEGLYDLAQQGNKKSLQLWEEFGKYLGFGLIGVVKAYDPDIIILGGQISKAYKFFSKSMNKELKYKPLFKLPIIKVSKLKNAAIAAAFVNK